MGRGRGFPVAEQPQHGAGGAAFHQRAQQPGTIPGPATAGIVLSVGEDHRAVCTRGTLHRLGDGLIRIPDTAGEGCLTLVDHFQKRIGSAIGGALVVGIGHQARPHLGDVCEREAAGQRHCAYRVGDQIGEPRVEGFGRLHQGATPVQRNDELRAPKRRRPPIAGLDEAQQVSGGARAGLTHVHMGVGAIDLENIGVAHHGLGEIGV